MLEEVPQLRPLSSWVSLVCVSLTKTNEYTGVTGLGVCSWIWDSLSSVAKMEMSGYQWEQAVAKQAVNTVYITESFASEW